MKNANISMVLISIFNLDKIFFEQTSIMYIPQPLTYLLRLKKIHFLTSFEPSEDSLTYFIFPWAT